MDNKIIILFGVPGCGKSTWAKQFQKENPSFVRICNDELRETLFGRIFDAKDNGLLLIIRDAITLNLFKEKQNIIIDNTNVSKYMHEQYLRWAKANGYQFIVKDLSDVPYDLCLQRNNARDRVVPENVISSMYTEMNKTKRVLYVEGKISPEDVRFI